MNSPKKSPDSKATPSVDFSEGFSRTQCLLALFDEVVGDDPFLLQQLKSSIETKLNQAPQSSNKFEDFCAEAGSLYKKMTGNAPSYGYVHLDYSQNTWDPLFAQNDLVRQLKKSAGYKDIFLVVRDLDRGINPSARYQTTKRHLENQEATRLIEECAQKWSTKNSKIHILFL